MRQPSKHEAGSILIAFALFITLMLSFAAVATEGGRWYLVRAELSKAVDAGALEGAKNISNPYVSPTTLAVDFCNENFQNGYLGTPGSGTGTAAFTAEMVGTNKIKVNGNASAVAILGKIVGFKLIPVAASGAAAMNSVEIMMILDRSGSMAGQPMTDLKNAAKGFVNNFASTQTKDKMGLISFSTTVKLDRAMGTNFVTPINTAITAMPAAGWTNSEEAIDLANAAGGFTNQQGVPSDARVPQFAIFFSDGRPNTIRWTFKYKTVTYDALAQCDGNCDPGETQVGVDLLNPTTGNTLVANGSMPTGDGVFPGGKYGRVSTRWNVFDFYPVPGYAADFYNIPEAKLHDQLCSVAMTLALLHAKELKDAGISVFTIGLGPDVHTGFMTSLASSPDMYYHATTSADLAPVFQKVAQDIRLRLVQ